MGLFGKKKEEKKAMPETEHLPNLPEFPSAEQHEELPELPHYEPSIGELKKEVARPLPANEFEGIPQRRAAVRPTLAAVKVAPHEKMMEHEPRRMAAAYISHDEEKPLFIKVDNYKEALKAIESLKVKVTEAEKILRSLEEIREQEYEKLEMWKNEVQALKEKLLKVDESLFEA